MITQSSRTGNFNPYLKSYTLAATATSQNTAVTQPTTGDSNNAIQQTAGEGAGYTDLLVYNASASAVAFVSWGTSAATATLTSAAFVPPGTSRVFNMGLAATNIAVILSTSTGNVYFAVGEGRG